MPRSVRSTLLAVLFAVALPVGAQQSAPAQPAGSAEAKRFVEVFIERYYGQFKEDANRPENWDPVAIVRRALTRELAEALAADRAAAVANQEEIVGLDFDPFSNSQDPCETYKTGRVAQRADTLMVELLGECHGQIPLIPDAVYLLVRVNRELAIADIAYPQGGSLRNVLRQLDEMRRRPTPPLSVQR